jgi:hypothetical protein
MKCEQLVAAALTAQHQQLTTNSIVLFHLEYYLFSQLSYGIVFILFGQMSDLHQFGLLELFLEHLETCNRPDLSTKDKISSTSFQRFFFGSNLPRKPSKDVTRMSVRRQWLTMCVCLLRTYRYTGTIYQYNVPMYRYNWPYFIPHAQPK